MIEFQHLPLRDFFKIGDPIRAIFQKLGPDTYLVWESISPAHRKGDVCQIYYTCRVTPLTPEEKAVLL
jgi:hypothetical protein